MCCLSAIKNKCHIIKFDILDPKNSTKSHQQIILGAPVFSSDDEHKNDGENRNVIPTKQRSGRHSSRRNVQSDPGELLDSVGTGITGGGGASRNDEARDRGYCSDEQQQSAAHPLLHKREGAVVSQQRQKNTSKPALAYFGAMIFM